MADRKASRRERLVLGALAVAGDSREGSPWNT